MNFIYTILSFTLTSLAFLFIANQIEPPTGHSALYDFVEFVGWGMAFMAFITAFITMFRNMVFKTDFKELINKIRRKRLEIVLAQEELETYKNEVEDKLTKIYPDYEKDLFKSMNPNDSQTLAAIMLKYPDFKFNTVLTEYTNGLQNKLNHIKALKSEVLYTKNDLQNIKDNGWLLIYLEIPKDIE